MSQKPSTHYTCKECGAEAHVIENGTIHRTCEHHDKPVTAHLYATAYGESHFNKEK